MSIEVALVAGVLGLGGLAAALGSLCYLHLAPTGLSPVRNPVSQYGITSFRSGYRAATISLGVAGAAVAAGVAGALSEQGLDVVVGLLVVFAIGRLIISWFPMDPPGAPPTSTGHAHLLIAATTFSAATVAAIRLGSVLSRSARWHGLASVSTDLGWAMGACVAGMLFSRLSPELRSYFGAIERGLYVAIISWLAVLAIACVAGSP